MFTSAAGNTLSFTYTVQDGDTAADLDVTTLNLNGAVIEDAAGNAASFSFSGELAAAAAIVIDTTAPDAPTVDALVTLSLLPSITGTTGTGAGLPTDETLTVVVNGATYEVTPNTTTWSLDLAAAVPTSGTLGAFTDGTYPVTATVTDEAGNTGSVSVANALVVDTTAPAAPTVDALLTKLDNPTLTGTVTLGEGETLTVTVDGVDYDSDGEVTVVNNDWSLDLSDSGITPAVELTDGTYPVTATVTDTAGNSVNDSTTEELVVDSTGPSVVAVSYTHLTLPTKRIV